MDLKVWYAIPTCNIIRVNGTFLKWKKQGYLTAALVNGLPREMASKVDADVIVYSEKYPGWPESVNILSRYLGDAVDILVTGGDDIYPDPRHDAQEIASQFQARFGSSGFGVMQPTGEDWGGYNRKICASPWFGKAWLNEGYGGKGPLWREYNHFFADEELRELAQMLGILWQRDDLSQFHDHWSRKGGPPKEGYQTALDKFWSKDETLFKMRKASKFPFHGRLVPVKNMDRWM